jgi:imidazolonepropionase-like amidohydrolase
MLIPILLAAAPHLAGAAPPVPVELSPTAGKRLAIRARRVHGAGDAVLENAVVLIEEGRILAVGGALEVGAGVRLIEHEGDLSAGLIALRDYSGADGENVDGTRPLMAEGRLSFALNPTHSDFRRLRAEGITAIVLGAPPSALAPGQTAVVKTAGGKIVKDPAHLLLSLSAESRSISRSPTSFGSAAAELAERLESGEGALARAKSGELPVLLAVGARHEILRAVDLATRHGLSGALVGAPLAGELADLIRGSGLAVVLSPFELGASGRELRALRALAEAEVPFGFALDAPAHHPAGLRLAAAAAVRAGVARDTARRALTSTAARIAGVDERIGRIAAGLDADLCLWSGDPIDLTSRLQAVFIDGERVFSSSETEDDQ